jgi:hypothetical protein
MGGKFRRKHFQCHLPFQRKLGGKIYTGVGAFPDLFFYEKIPDDTAALKSARRDIYLMMAVGTFYLIPAGFRESCYSKKAEWTTETHKKVYSGIVFFKIFPLYFNRKEGNFKML